MHPWRHGDIHLMLFFHVSEIEILQCFSTDLAGEKIRDCHLLWAHSFDVSYPLVRAPLQIEPVMQFLGSFKDVSHNHKVVHLLLSLFINSQPLQPEVPGYKRFWIFHDMLKVTDQNFFEEKKFFFHYALEYVISFKIRQNYFYRRM